MKKNVFIILGLLLVACSCQLDTADDSSLQYIDCSQFHHDSVLVFPAETNTLSLYNCLSRIENLEKLHGKVEQTYYEKLPNGDYFRTSQTRIVKNITLSEEHRIAGESIHKYTIDITFDYGDESSSDFNYEYNKNLPQEARSYKFANYVYKWQYNKHNIWENDKLPFTLTIFLNDYTAQ